MAAFIVPGISALSLRANCPSRLTSPRFSVVRIREWHPQRKCQPHMSSSIGRFSLYAGVTFLAAIVANRLFFTPPDSLELAQSRSDIIGVITSATLVLYGVGKEEIADKKKAVELSGVDVRRGFDESAVSKEVEWALSALLQGIPNVQSCALLVDGVGQFFLGRFPTDCVEASVKENGVVADALSSGQRAYLADMKVVPVKEVEFGFLPKNCQAVIVQPVSSRVALILGADKPRPLTGGDFGWLQAISDRLNAVITGAGVPYSA